MNTNDPRLELVHRAKTGDLSTEEHAQLEMSLREDARFRELYVRYWNMDLALSTVAESSPVPASFADNWIAALARRVLRRASQDPTPQGGSATERQPNLDWRLGFALVAVAWMAYFLPLPQSWLHSGEQVFQRGSAEVSYQTLQLLGTPVSRNAFQFQLPGLTIEFSEACSGLRSTLVLLTVGAVLAFRGLNTGWRQWVLLLAIVPFAIVQKGLWVGAIATLAVRVDPNIVNSWIYHRGEAINLTLSLLALIGFAGYLHRSECKARG